MQRVDVWFPRTIPGTKCIHGIDYGNGTYVAVGDGIFTSRDGITWSKRYTTKDAHVYDVTFDGTRFIAITPERRPDPGWKGCYNDYLYALISADGGVNWHPGVVSSQQGYAIANAAVPGRCVAVGSDIRTLRDGSETWQVTNDHSFSGYFHDICVGKDSGGKDLFVAVGESGLGDPTWTPYTAISHDGVHWQVGSGDFEGLFVSVAYGNGVFVAIGPDATELHSGGYDGTRMDRGFFKSTDGLHWTRQKYQAAGDLNKIAFGSGIFVAVGAGGNVYVSNDGEVWSVRNVGTTTTLIDVHYCGNCFVVAAPDGTIFQSERFDQPFIEIAFNGYGSVEVEPLSARHTGTWGFTCPRDSVITLKASGEYIPRWIKTPAGQTIELTTTILTGFDGWTGSNPANPESVDTHKVIQVKMDADRHLTAHFSIMRFKPPTGPSKPNLNTATTATFELLHQD